MAIDVLSDRSYNGIKESVATAKNVATSTAKSAVAQKKVAVQSDDIGVVFIKNHSGYTVFVFL